MFQKEIDRYEQVRANYDRGTHCQKDVEQRLSVLTSPNWELICLC